MKIAYLIMAHTDAPQLKRLISSLYVQNVTDFFVHIDKKSNIKPFCEELASLPCKISFVENRVNNKKVWRIVHLNHRSLRVVFGVTLRKMGVVK